MTGHVRQSLLSDLASLGPFFAVETHASGQIAPPPWRPMTTLIDGSAALEARVQAVRTAIAGRVQRRPEDIAIRVVASVAHLGLIARLLAPAIGASALGHRVAIAADELWWQNHLGGPYPLSISVEPAIDTPVLPGGAVEAITGAFAECYGVSERVLWGNVGSAANSAAQLVATARPSLTIRAHHAADSILADPRVDGGVLKAGPDFRRRSCCLIYRIANDQATICGDCILR